MTHHKPEPVDASRGLSMGDKKSHYTALLVGIGCGSLVSSLVLLAVAITHNSG